MAIVTSQRQASSEEIVAEMDRRGLVIQQLEELRDRLCDDIKTLRDDVEMEKRVREEWRQRCEWALRCAEKGKSMNTRKEQWWESPLRFLIWMALIPFIAIPIVWWFVTVARWLGAIR